MKCSSSDSECKDHDRQEINTEHLEKFTKMVQNASILANRLSSSELVSAFQVSFHLMEKISYVILNMCTSSKNGTEKFTGFQTPWKYPSYLHCMINNDSPIGFFSKTQSLSENDDFEVTDQQESQLKVVVEEEEEDEGDTDENLCDSGIASNRDGNLRTESTNSNSSCQKLSPMHENHYSNNYSNKCLSSPITNTSSVIDVDENYSMIVDKCDNVDDEEEPEVSRTTPTSEIIDNNDIKQINMAVNNSKIYLKNRNSTTTTIRKATTTNHDKQFDDEHVSSLDISDQHNNNNNNNGDNNDHNNSAELYDSQTTTPTTTTTTTTTNRFHVDSKRWRLTSADKLNTLIDECERQINGRKLYVCKFCGKIYEIKSSMRYHMKIIHLQMHLRTTEMQCRICGKQFTCVSAVNRHQSKCILSTNNTNNNNNNDSRIHNNTVSSNHSSFHNSVVVAAAAGTTTTTTTPPSSFMDNDDMHSRLSVNSFTSQTLDHCNNNNDFNHHNQTSLNNSNILMESLNSVSKNFANLANFPSAFHIPDTTTTCTSTQLLIDQSISKLCHNNSQTTNLNLPNFIPSSNFMNLPNKSNSNSSSSLSFQSFNDNNSSHDKQSILNSITNNHNNRSVDCFNTSSPQWNASTWSTTMPNLGCCNFTELTPAQLDICMKAVVQGICSTVEQCNNNNNTSNNINSSTNQELNESFPIPMDPAYQQSAIDETQWNAALKNKTLSNLTETPTTDRTLTSSQTNEMVAMDLSSRPRSATMMIESF